MRFDEGPEEGDAFGAYLLALLDDPEGHPPELIERSDGLLMVGQTGLRYIEPPRETWSLERLPRGRVLDVGAGGGRVTLWLQEHGADAVALDISPGAIEVCRRRGCRSTFLGTVYDLAATTPEPFDGFAMLGNNLGLLGGREEAQRMLAAMATISRPGAVIVGTCLDPYQTDRPEHLALHEANRAAGRMGGQLRLRERYLRLADPWFEYLFMSVEELEGLLIGTPWRLEEHLGDEQGQYEALIRLMG